MKVRRARGVRRELRTQESEDKGQEGQGSKERIKETGV